MIFTNPEYFFIVPALILLGWRLPSLRLHEPLRAAALLLCVFILAGPRLGLAGGGLDLWVLVDRSDSASAGLATQGPELEAILEKTRHRQDRIHYVDYAVDVVRREQGDPEFRGGTHQTRTGLALEFALSQLDPARASRLLLIGDGYATEPLGRSTDRVLRSEIPLDYRLLKDDTAGDIRVGSLEMPTRVLPGESFLVEFSISGDGNEQVPWELVRGGTLAAKGSASLRNGSARVRLSDRLGGTGAVRYELRIRPTHDKYTQNNSSSAWVEVAGGPKVLLLSEYADDPLVPLLQKQGIAVVHVAEPRRLTAADLSATRLVIFNNVPASVVAPEFLAALPFFVREQGGGLLMAGGPASFGAGGYYSSAIDPLLPVSMELKRDQRKLATAMAIIMDRSGSMAASAGGGLRKMDLANAGAARAIELLGDFDAVSVYAVDTVPHEIAALCDVGKNRDELKASVLRIESMGAGIYIEEGLQAGWEQLKKAETGQRHLVLFADANDSRQHPGDYAKIIDEMKTGGATISVIGMGNDTDKDADILKDIAERGGGRAYFNADPNELPALFAQETVTIARSAFITDPTPTQGTASWAEIGAKTPQWMAKIDGYNLSYLKPEASVSLLSQDEYVAPLVAFWPRGAGRVAAVSFPLGGYKSDLTRAWPGYGDFVQTLTRWLAGEDAPAGLALKPLIEGEQLSLDLYYDDTWSEQIARQGPLAILSEAGIKRGPDTQRSLIWEKIQPGHFRASSPLIPGRPVRGAVRVGASSLPFGPLSAAGEVEWSFDHDRLQELQQLSQRSGGVERLDLGTIWDSPRKVHERSLVPWLLPLWLLLMLSDALLTKLGISLLPKRNLF
jgi:hypothetical protein